MGGEDNFLDLLAGEDRGDEVVDFRVVVVFTRMAWQLVTARLMKCTGD